MNTYVKNITSEDITLCDLNNTVLVPSKVINLLNYATQSEIDVSEDLQFAIEKGFVQLGYWKPNTFVVTQYNKTPDKTNLENINKIYLSEIHGHPTTCSQEFPIHVLASFFLKQDPTTDLEAATKHYVDSAIAYALEHAHDGNISIGGDLLVHGDAEILEILTATAIVTQSITGITDSSGVCSIDVSCNFNMNGFILPLSSSDSYAPNNSIYYSENSNKLVYKDGSGIVNNLY